MRRVSAGVSVAGLPAPFERTKLVTVAPWFQSERLRIQVRTADLKEAAWVVQQRCCWVSINIAKGR